MTFTLRSYQSAACEAALAELRATIDPCLIDAAPAAGKSFMIAYIAGELHRISGGKRVLCLAPNSKLVRQNHEKYLMTGERASIFSASAGAKSTRNVVVFGTPGTVKNSISRFTRQGQEGYCAVIVDECHGLTPTIRAIIDEMRQANPNLRVLGLSGTPFILGKGYIYRIGPDGRSNGDDTCRDPYFTKCVYRVSAREMLEAKRDDGGTGFITPMRIGAINEGAYDTSGVVLLPNGTLQADTVERAFVGHGRKTAAIVADVIAQARNQYGGVMFFAATQQHAQEIMASLPPGNSALSTGEYGILMGKPASDDAIVKAYRAQAFRYLVSVAKYTTGFDVDHTGTIALLRYTESAALLQQILGRAWRLHPDKPEGLLLDYAGNVERHFPDGDIYNPRIEAKGAGGSGEKIDAQCPDCGHVNLFSLHPDYADYQRDRHGYALDVFGQQIMSEFGPVSTHYGRRCFGELRTGPKGEYERCGYRWTGKDCPECGEKNDIAARYCYACKAEIVNPNDRLVAEFRQLKRDPTRPQTDRVHSFEVREGMSQRGNATIRIDFVTPYRQFSIWLMKDPKSGKQAMDLKRWQDCGGNPETVSYVKEPESGFFRVLAYNQPADDEEQPEFVLAETEKMRKVAA